MGNFDIKKAIDNATINDTRVMTPGGNQSPGKMDLREAAAIVADAQAAGMSNEDIKKAFDKSGKDKSGMPVARFLPMVDISFAVMETPVPVPKKQPVMVSKGFTFESSALNGKMEVKPQPEIINKGEKPPTTTKLDVSGADNPYKTSSTDPNIRGRDQLFDELLLRNYGFKPHDPLNAEDKAIISELLKDPMIAKAKDQFVDRGIEQKRGESWGDFQKRAKAWKGGDFTIELPKKPEWFPQHTK